MSTFSITTPPILVYESDPTASGGLRLVGVSYLITAPADADGQPVNPPFPKSLARWHKHGAVCVLPDNSATAEESTESQCIEHGGQFMAETPDSLAKGATAGLQALSRGRKGPLHA